MIRSFFGYQKEGDHFKVMFYFRNPLGQGAQLMVLGAILAPLVSTTCVPSSDELNSPLLKDKVFGSDVVAHGTVARHFPDPRWPSAFIAELLVQCVYKGGPLDSVINITQAGKNFQSSPLSFTGQEKGSKSRVHSDVRVVVSTK